MQAQQAQTTTTLPAKPKTAAKKSTTTETPTPTITETPETAPVTAPSPSTGLITTEAEQIKAALGDTVETQTGMSPVPIPDLVGGPVFYVLPHNKQRRPGEITYDHETEDQKVDLTIKTRGTRDFPEGAHGSLGVLPVHDVVYAPAATKTPGTWHWRTERA
jgi:hypothetical protein